VKDFKKALLRTFTNYLQLLNNFQVRYLSYSKTKFVICLYIPIFNTIFFLSDFAIVDFPFNASLELKVSFYKMQKMTSYT